MTNPIISAWVIVASTRAARGIRPDATGPVLYEFLHDLGYSVFEPVVVPDGKAVGDALARAIASDARVVLTTGGTGITPTDQTPEFTRRLLDRELPGIAEAIRATGIARGLPGAMLSRGVAGIAGRTLVINLPGSFGAVNDSVTLLRPLLPHAIDQLEGRDHPFTLLPPAE